MFISKELICHPRFNRPKKPPLPAKNHDFLTPASSQHQPQPPQNKTFVLGHFNPVKKRSLQAKNREFITPAFSLHQPEQPQEKPMTPFDWLLLAADIARQELETEEEEKKKKKIEIVAVEIPPALQRPAASNEHNENKRKRKDSSASQQPPHPLRDKRRKMTSNNASCSAAVAQLPPEFKHRVTEMGGKEEEAFLVIQKKLFKTDLEPNNGRFSIPSRQVVNDFLTAQEKSFLHVSKARMENVPLIEPDGTSVCPITLTWWDMFANGIYNLITNWNRVTKRNALVEGDVVQLWAFRTHPSQKLCLALVYLPIHSRI